MIHKSVIKNDETEETTVCIALEKEECLTDQAVEWIKEVCKVMLASCFSDGIHEPNKVYGKIRNKIERELGSVGMYYAREFMLDFTSKDSVYIAKELCKYIGR